ncbi:MAG: tetratricopeptide repeat protein [Gammaproteobacteria bacterium]
MLTAVGLALWLSGTEGWTQERRATDAATPSSSASPSNDADARALIALGAVQADLHEFAAAEGTYLRGIEHLTEAHGEFAPILIDPYRGLAQVYVRSGRSLEALTVLEHAQHISQRNYGLFNVVQTIILDEMSEAYVTAGDTRSAQDIQQERLNIGLRRFGEDDLDLIPFRYHLAEYYALSRMHGRAREQYEDVIEIQESHLVRYSGDLLKPLRELVRIDILSGNSSSARRRLQEILELGEAIPAMERARSLAVLGDWALTNGQLATGLSHYRDADAVLAGDEGSRAVELFSSPALINFIPPPSPVDRTGGSAPYEWGAISADFEISAEGRARNVQIVAATPPGLMDARYRARLMESYFRPRLVAGEPIATPHVRFTHQFRYFRAD